MQKILLVVNAKAGQAHDAATGIEEFFKSRGIEVVVGDCQSAHDYQALMRKHESGFDAVVAAGGDGTVCCAAEALIGTGVPLAIIPLGTANNVARSLGLPLDITQACEAVLVNPRRPMDLARINGRIFVSVVGIGLSAIVHKDIAHEHKRKWGAFGYLIQAFRSLKKLGRGFRARIRSAEETIEVRAAQITVCNGRYYGAHLEVSNDATLSDGCLDLSVVEAKKYFRAFFNYLAPWDKTSATTGLKLLRSKTFEIETYPTMKVDVEGGSSEIHTPARVEVLPGAIEALAPAL